MTDVTSPSSQATDGTAASLSGMRRLRQLIAQGFFPADQSGRVGQSGQSGQVGQVGRKMIAFLGYPLITVVCGGLALARLGPAGPNTIWAEDGQVFYTGAVEHPLRSFVEPWHGYLVTTSRILAAIVALFPVSWAAAVNATVDALAMGLLAALVYRACRAHIATPWLRLVPAVATAICPIGGETWGVVSNLMWPMYFVAVLVMLWNPRRPGGIAVGAVTVLLLTLTSPFGILLAPVAVVRIIVLGRDRGSVIPVAALTGTIVETVDSVLSGSRQTYTTVLPGKLVHNYLFNVAERGFFGAHYQIAAYETVGAVVVVAVVAAIALAGVARKARQCALGVLILTYSIGYYTVVLVLSGTFTGHSTGDRYYVGPFLLLAYAMVVAFDAAITTAAITADGPLRAGLARFGGRFGGFPRGGSVPRLAAAVLCAALTGCLAFSVATDWYSHEKARQSPTWAASLASARASCVGQPGDKVVRLRITASHPAVPWYVTLNCSQVG